MRLKSNVGSKKSGHPRCWLWRITFSGIAKRKDSLTQKYDVIDKSNLQTWRTYVGEVTSQKQMDVASFLDALSTASKETAKRMEVPNKKFDKTLSSAEKVRKLPFFNQFDVHFLGSLMQCKEIFFQCYLFLPLRSGGSALICISDIDVVSARKCCYLGTG